MASQSITQGDIKAFLKRLVRDDVAQYRRELAIQRINVNKAIGVGNMTDFIREWEQDFPNSTITQKSSEPKNKTLKRVTQTKKKAKL
jgi:hypothetical protein